MILSSNSQVYKVDFSKVATMLMGINLFQIEEELMKLTTNNQQRQETINEYNYNQEMERELAFN